MSKKNKKSSEKKVVSKKIAKKTVSKTQLSKKVKPSAKKNLKVVSKKKIAPKAVAKKKLTDRKTGAKEKVKKLAAPGKKPAVKPAVAAKKAAPAEGKNKNTEKKIVEAIVVSKPLTKTELKAQAKAKAIAINKVQEKNKQIQAQKLHKGFNFDDHKPAHEPAGKFILEYVVHSSAELLYNFLTEPSGLSEWFCDDVNYRNGVFTFFWDGSQQLAKELKNIPEKLFRFQWMDKTDGSYVEFRIDRDELTGDISLMITDFAENPEERISSKLLWDSQINKLLHVMGAYF